MSRVVITRRKGSYERENVPGWGGRWDFWFTGVMVSLDGISAVHRDKQMGCRKRRAGLGIDSSGVFDRTGLRSGLSPLERDK
jgi:hypothetical protein